jgi:DNA-binding transcriptional LysR family regulator
MEPWAMFQQVNDMLVFAAVARAGSLTRGGALLGLPKSTVSRRLAALEERLGSRLVERSARKLVLSEAGLAFLERCQRLADDVDDALAFAGELSDEPRGALRVTMPPGFGDVVTADALASFVARYPGISLFLDESPRFVDLVAERYDLAIRAGVLPDSTMVARKLFEQASGVFASPSYLARHPAPETPADLADHTFVVLEGRARFDRVQLRSGERTVEVALPSTVTATSTSMQLALGIVGAGAIVYSGRGCQENIAAGRLVRVLPAWTTAPAPIWIVTPSRRLLPRKTVLFIEHLEATLGRDEP